MAMNLKMSLKLSQQLRMTPQLQQAIKLLQLSRVELETEIRRELLENPVLEEIGEDDLSRKELAGETADVSAQGDSGDPDPRKQDEFEWDTYFEEKQRQGPGVSAGFDEIMNYENLISTTQSLQDYLMWQATLSGFNEEEANLAAVLISYINDEGYLSLPIEEIAAEEGIAAQDLEEVLPFIQEFDPPGVGARHLRECLILQARHLEEDTKDLVAMIENHLPDLEKKNYPAIARAMNLDLEVVLEMAKIVLSMDPKPGRRFTVNDAQFITPDVYVYKVGDEYVVSLNEEGLPRLRVSNLYRHLLAGDKKSEDQTQEYVQDKLRSAIWLIKSIHQRQRTIYKVSESIVRHQREFFEKGPAFIKPMILRDIANDIGMHESTVSRVTTNKYVHTPRGIFELKYFFNSGITGTDGDAVASEAIKLKIKEMVGKEDARRPLSDQKLVELLEKDGIQIARRTVAKYREMLKILPSSKRKRYF